MMHSWTLSANLGSDGIASFSKNGLTWHYILCPLQG
jgi:hypothetical protein